jgi:hypothetical protein
MMKNKEENGKGKDRGKKPASLPVFPFGSFFLPLLIPVPKTSRKKRSLNTCPR